MNTQHHSERTDSRRKPRFQRLELQRRRRREDAVFDLLEDPDGRQRYPMYCH